MGMLSSKMRDVLIDHLDGRAVPIVKPIALTIAAPFLGLAMIVAAPFVGLALFGWFGTKALLQR